jgi:hypothetical protein
MKSKNSALSAGTDTASFYLIAPEQLNHLIRDGEWLALYQSGDVNQADHLIMEKYHGDFDHTGMDGHHVYYHDSEVRKTAFSRRQSVLKVAAVYMEKYNE